MADHVRMCHPDLTEEERANYRFVAKPIIQRKFSQITPVKGRKSPKGTETPPESLQDVGVHPAESPPPVPLSESSSSPARVNRGTKDWLLWQEFLCGMIDLIENPKNPIFLNFTNLVCTV